MPNTVQFHRVLRAAPEKVYRAFLDADAMAKWLPPNGFTGKVHHPDAKVGGTYKMSFTNFTTHHGHSDATSRSARRDGERGHVPGLGPRVLRHGRAAVVADGGLTAHTGLPSRIPLL